MTLYPSYGTGYPVLKVYEGTTLKKTATMSIEHCLVIKNLQDIERNDIQDVNLDLEAFTRKGSRRYFGDIVLDNVSTTLLEALAYADEQDGVYGWRLELQPFSSNSAFKFDVTLTAPIVPRNADDKLNNRRQLTVSWKAVPANIAFSGIKKYS